MFLPCGEELSHKAAESSKPAHKPVGAQFEISPYSQGHPEPPSNREGFGVKPIHPLFLRCCQCTPDPSGLKPLRMTPLENDGVELGRHPPATWDGRPRAVMVEQSSTSPYRHEASRGLAPLDSWRQLSPRGSWYLHRPIACGLLSFRMISDTRIECRNESVTHLLDEYRRLSPRASGVTI